MSYETATKIAKRCVVKLILIPDEKIGAANDPDAPIHAGYLLRAQLTDSLSGKLLAVASFKLPESDSDPDQWCRIERNPALIQRATKQLIETARDLGYRSVEVVDFSVNPARTLSTQKIAAKSPVRSIGD